MICNKFKPERCHHCSTCGRCVLVMDHHCPWLNNCVGFRNRKIFMLLITYAFVLAGVGLIYSIYPIINLVIVLVKGDTSYLAVLVVGIVGYGLDILFFIIMILFLRTHYDLINKNMTTIEQLDEKRGNVKTVTYDMGYDFNYKTVFGQNKVCWGCPYDRGDAAPFGDGTVFIKQDLSNRKLSATAEDNDPYFEEDPIFEDNWGDGKDFNDPLNKMNDNYSGKNPLRKQLA